MRNEHDFSKNRHTELYIALFVLALVVALAYVFCNSNSITGLAMGQVGTVAAAVRRRKMLQGKYLAEAFTELYKLEKEVFNLPKMQLRREKMLILIETTRSHLMKERWTDALLSLFELRNQVRNSDLGPVISVQDIISKVEGVAR